MWWINESCNMQHCSNTYMNRHTPGSGAVLLITNKMCYFTNSPLCPYYSYNIIIISMLKMVSIMHIGLIMCMFIAIVLTDVYGHGFTFSTSTINLN